MVEGRLTPLEHWPYRTVHDWAALQTELKVIDLDIEFLYLRR